MRNDILKFKKEGLRALNFFFFLLQFPVVVASYSELEDSKLIYLEKLVEEGRLKSTKDICVWCIRQNVQYQILYQPKLRDLFKHPITIYEYKHMQNCLRRIREE